MCIRMDIHHLRCMKMMDISRDHRNGAFAKTLIECNGPDFGSSGIVSITVGESIGEYDGKPESALLPI